jgi:sigma-B regulation protein RsbQ
MAGFQFSQHNVNFVGGGRQTLVLAHGFGSNQTVWRHVLPWLAARHRVMLFDMAGSTAANAAFYALSTHDGIEDYARDLVVLLDRHGVGRATYIGHGAGGTIGLVAARERPDLFQRLVLVGSSPCHIDDGAYYGGFTAAELGGMLSAMAKDYRGWVEMYAPAVVGIGPEQRAAVAEYAASLLELPPPIAVAAARTIFAADVRPLLAEVKTPTLVVQARQDPLVPMAAAEHLERHLPHGRIAFLDAEGHMTPMTAADRLVRLLAAHGLDRAAAA